MNKPLVYLDQCIIGLIADGTIKMKSSDGFIFTYSKEHFNEILRSENPQLYLNALHKIDAKLLELKLDENWKITDEAKLNVLGTPTEHYTKFLDANSTLGFLDNIFDPLIAWLNGGR